MSERRDLIFRVNGEVNLLPYVADVELYGQPEFWKAIEANGGDCEDFALGKRARLLAAGVPLHEMRIGLCHTETGGSHAVLVVACDGGHLILDNRQPTPYTMDEFRGLGYRGNALQRETDGAWDWEEWE